MKCAVIDNNTNLVINIIIADTAVDKPHEGTLLIDLQDNDQVAIGWKYDKKTNTFNEVNI